MCASYVSRIRRVRPTEIFIRLRPLVRVDTHRSCEDYRVPSGSSFPLFRFVIPRYKAIFLAGKAFGERFDRIFDRDAASNHFSNAFEESFFSLGVQRSGFVCLALAGGLHSAKRCSRANAQLISRQKSLLSGSILKTAHRTANRLCTFSIKARIAGSDGSFGGTRRFGIGTPGMQLHRRALA